MRIRPHDELRHIHYGYGLPRFRPIQSLLCHPLEPLHGIELGAAAVDQNDNAYLGHGFQGVEIHVWELLVDAARGLLPFAFARFPSVISSPAYLAERGVCGDQFFDQTTVVSIA